MTNYVKGEYYNFRVTGLSNRHMYLEDESRRTYSVYAYDFQTEWDWSSPQASQQMVRCYVKDISDYDQLKLEQSSEMLLALLYPEAYAGEKKICVFTVKELKTIGTDLFYILIDAYGITHLHKPSARYQSLQPGDEIKLYVNSIEEKEKDKGNNRFRLIFEEIETITSSASATSTVSTVASDEDVPFGEFGEENDKVEFKSTLIYPAGATGPDIDTQMHIILRTIAGFMNADGGTLYIGVNNNGDAVGIEQDYPLLNTSTKDKHTYYPSKDGYENKIRSSITRHLSSIAQDLVSIKFLDRNEHTVCKVEVEVSDRVIWYDERHAYKRIGNMTAHLRDQLIEKLVLDKMKLTLPEAYRVKPTVVQSVEDILLSEPINDIEQDEKPTIVKAAKPELIKMIGEEKQGKGSFYMNLFANGDWSWSKEMPKDDNLEFCIPINSPASKNYLMMVYADGCVNKVNAYKLHNTNTEGKRYKNGRRKDGVKLVKVFHANENDLLACFCKQNGHEFVKVHSVSHVSAHDKKNIMHLKGNILINTGNKSDITEPNIYFVSSQHSQRVSVLMKTENQTSNILGFQMDHPKNAKFINVRDTLRALCDVPAMMEEVEPTEI